MAFDIRNLQRIASMGQVVSAVSADNTGMTTFWGYATNDDNATVVAANYFNSQAGYMKKGDLILASLDQNGAAAAKMYIVTAVTATTVTIAVATGLAT